MRVHLASDHAGFAYKEALKEYLEHKNYLIIDHGAYELDQDDDYPDFIIPAAEAVAQDENALGIIFGASGQGEAIAANKVPGIRTAVYYGGDKKIVTLSREHNNANILSLGARFLESDEVTKVVDLWLNTKFSDEERHVRRLNKISKFEKGIYPRIGLGVIIKSGNKILLGKRKNSHDAGVWAVPGGHLEKFETLEDTALREVKEETGMEVKYIETIGHVEDFYQEDYYHYISFYIKTKWIRGEPRVLEPDKCEEWRWFKLDEIPDNAAFSLKNFINKFKDHLYD